MHRNSILGILVAILIVGLAAMVTAADKGPANIDIYGGSSGNVPFPHLQHQDRIQDCNVCHAVFGQETDAIKKMKTQGVIKPKKVMNLQCIKCHKDEKRAGRPSGPLTCKTCHVKA
jgi:hypothetical protein